MADEKEAPVDPRKLIKDAAKELAQVCSDGAYLVKEASDGVVSAAADVSRVVRDRKSQRFMRAVKPGEPVDKTPLSDGLTARYEALRPTR